MSENSQTVRPTKKQHQTLNYIKGFIAEHGYSPSYREIMNGCNYTSVATVSLHVNNLIKRGHLVKRGKSARSLELASGGAVATAAPTSTHGQHLVKEIDARFKKLEKEFKNDVLDEIYVLVGALKILGHPEPAAVYAKKIHVLDTGK